MRKPRHCLINFHFVSRKALSNCSRGSAAIEFAIIAPVVMVLFLGIADLTIVIKDRFTLSNYNRSLSSIIHEVKGVNSDVSYNESLVRNALFRDVSRQPAYSTSRACYCGSISVPCSSGGSCSSGSTFEEYVAYETSYTSSPPFFLPDVLITDYGLVRISR